MLEFISEQKKAGSRSLIFSFSFDLNFGKLLFSIWIPLFFRFRSLLLLFDLKFWIPLISHGHAEKGQFFYLDLRC